MRRGEEGWRKMFSRTDISGIRVRLVVIRLVSVLITNQGKAWKASAQCQLLRLAVEGFLPSPRTGCSVGSVAAL